MFPSPAAASHRRKLSFHARQTLLDRAVIEQLEQRTLLHSLTLVPAVPASYNLGTGTIPYSITIADINGDGIPDMIVANENGTVSVLLGKGNGVFQPPISVSDGLPSGTSPAFVAVGNLDPKQFGNKPDLVVASRGGTQVSVLLNQGTGTFGTATLFNAGSGANIYSLALADLAGDGVEDIVTGNQNDTLSVLKGYGNGTFQAYTTVSGLPHSSGNIDAVAWQPTTSGPVDLVISNNVYNDVTVLLNGGSDTFTTGTTYPVGLQPNSMVVSDVNNDKVPDLIVGSDGGSVSVLLGNTNGTFQQPNTINGVASNVESVAVADFDGDGNPDILVGGEFNGGGVVDVLFGNGNGTFVPTPFSMKTLNYYPNVATAVIGDNTYPDVLITNRVSESISVFLNTPSLPANNNIANISFSNGVVTGTGTDAADTASITMSGSDVVVTIDATSDSFPSASVNLINIDLLAGRDSISVGLGVPACSINGGGGADTIVAGNFAADTLFGGNGNDSIHGGGGAESLTGGEGADTIDGGTGHDTIDGDGGNDSIVGGSRAGESGGSLLDGVSGNDTILGGSADDTLIGGDGNDSISGGQGDDLLIGNGGNDTIIAGLGTNTLQANGGNDDLFGDAGGVDSIIGGAGHDSITGDIVLTGLDTIVATSGQDTIRGGPRDSIISAAGDSITGGANISTAANIAPQISSGSSLTLTAGTAGSFTVQTSATPTAKVVEKGALPAGVTFTDNGDGTATISGTPAAGAGGVYVLSIKAKNIAAPPARQLFVLTVDQSPALTSSATDTFTSGLNGTFTVTATGYPLPVLSQTGTLPNGVTFVPNGNGTATISGTATVVSNTNFTLNIQASNGIGAPATQTFTLTVAVPTITSSAGSAFTVGTAGTFSVTTAGFTSTPALSVSTGTLPSGVTFTDNANGTATLAGTPAAGTQGTYPVTITATGGGGTVNQSFVLTVNPAPPASISSATSTTFTVGTAGTFSVTTSGFSSTPTITDTGALPSGVTLTDNHNGTATLAGTPGAGTQASYPITITAMQGSTTAMQSFTLTVAAAASGEITSPNHTLFTVGSHGSFTVTTSGFSSTPTITSTGSTLPSGVTLVDNGNGTATLSGTPATGTNNTYTLTITATSGGDVVPQTFTLVVANGRSGGPGGPSSS
jgi:Ca2+-binding RTX toxin-like protein